MIQHFHLRFLAKAVAMDMLSKLAGYTNSSELLVKTGAQIEQNASKRREVLHELIREGFIEARVIGQLAYVITQKAFNDCGVGDYIGELNIGTPDKPLATWLCAEILKQAVEDLIGGRAVIKDATNGRGKVVVSTIDARSEEDVIFDRGLAENLGELACSLTQMSKAFSECLKVPPNSLTALKIEEELFDLHKAQMKEIERLKRTNDAMVVFFDEVEELGGWSEFIRLARTRSFDAKSPAEKISGVVAKRMQAPPGVSAPAPANPFSVDGS